ncbi:MAG: DNA-3-methyladenine glycosylase [Bacteroidetes bacterium]|nr:DNA-3-methyladenine glycosylase [Bacteroidota bacterium]
MRPLPRSFYMRSTLLVARELLGKTLVRIDGRRRITGIIVETEAYLQNDPASHSFRGPTKRNEPMFGPGGHLYVYFTYGMHYCANVVTGPIGRGEAVLIRAVEPTEGIGLMKKRRFPDNDASEMSEQQRRALTNGPAKLAQAFGMTTEHSGIDLVNGPVIISKGIAIAKGTVTTSTRIGISQGTEKCWRFYIKGNRWVSKT